MSILLHLPCEEALIPLWDRQGKTNSVLVKTRRALSMSLSDSAAERGLLLPVIQQGGPPKPNKSYEKNDRGEKYNDRNERTNQS